jgi:hypothetical protein
VQALGSLFNLDAAAPCINLPRVLDFFKSLIIYIRHPSPNKIPLENLFNIYLMEQFLSPMHGEIE